MRLQKLHQYCQTWLLFTSKILLKFQLEIVAHISIITIGKRSKNLLGENFYARATRFAHESKVHQKRLTTTT
jgi:hypothetical protein